MYRYMSTLSAPPFANGSQKTVYLELGVSSIDLNLTIFDFIFPIKN